MTEEELKMFEDELDRRLGLVDDATADASSTEVEPTKPETTVETIVRLEAEAGRLREEQRKEFSAERLGRLDTLRSEISDLKSRVARELDAKERFWKSRMSTTFITRSEFDREWESRWRQEALREEMDEEQRVAAASQHDVYRGF